MGTSSCHKGQHARYRDHPHAYGDKSIKKHCTAFNLGSSPRVWGQVEELAKEGYNIGIIPTRMGTSKYDLRVRPCPQDHPHAYGDKRLTRQLAEAVRGSSPRVWGQGLDSKYYIWHCRIIPTRMGTRVVAIATLASWQDHPHAYGDKTKEIKENSGFAKSTA